MSNTTPASPDLKNLHHVASTLKLHGLMAHWDELTDDQLRWISDWLLWEEHERTRRTLERRMSAARIGAFKPLAEFDWQWPERCDKAAISEAMTLGFVKQAANIVLLGSNGLGKSTIAQNITYQAVMQGHSALYVNAAQMLGDLAAQDGDLALRRRIKHYARPDVLTIDEIGYMTYGDRHADLLFEIINRRYETKSTVVTTNKAFGEWADMFPNNGSVVAIVDRLVHHIVWYITRTSLSSKAIPTACTRQSCVPARRNLRRRKHPRQSQPKESHHERALRRCRILLDTTTTRSDR